MLRHGVNCNKNRMPSFKNPLVLSCWNIQAFSEKDVLMGAYVDLKPCILFIIDSAFPDVYAANAIEANTPPYHQRGKLVKWTGLMAPLLFNMENVVSKKNFTIWFVWLQNG